MQRLRTVTLLDVSAVTGHHAMPAALLLLVLDDRFSGLFIFFALGFILHFHYFNCIEMIVDVVVLLFYVHGKHLRSCRDGQLT